MVTFVHFISIAKPIETFQNICNKQVNQDWYSESGIYMYTQNIHGFCSCEMFTQSIPPTQTKVILQMELLL